MVIYLDGGDELTIRYPRRVDGKKALAILAEHVWKSGIGDPLEQYNETTFEVLA